MLSMSRPPPRESGNMWSNSREFVAPERGIIIVSQAWHRKTPFASVAASSAACRTAAVGRRPTLDTTLRLSTTSSADLAAILLDRAEAESSASDKQGAFEDGSGASALAGDALPDVVGGSPGDGPGDERDRGCDDVDFGAEQVRPSSLTTQEDE